MSMLQQDADQGDDDSSAHTSAAAADSDDVAHMEDAIMDPNDFNFHLEPSSPTRDGPVASFSIPNVEKFNSSLDSGLGFGLALPPKGGAFTPGEGGELEAVKVTAATAPPPARKDQLARVRSVMEDKDLTKLRPGDTRFVVSLSWIQRWRDYVGWNGFDWDSPERPLTPDPPGPITNQDILEDDGVTLREFQTSRVECVVTPLWDLLCGWYGGNPIERRVIDDIYKPRVELYRMKLKLTRRNGASAHMDYSKGCTVGELRIAGAAALQLGPIDDHPGLRMFEVSGTYKCQELDDDKKLLSECFTQEKYTILFELPEDAGSEADNGLSDFLTSDTWTSDFTYRRRTATPGAVGLNNLGNTCFMNAAIQCLSHIPEVVEYFGGKGSSHVFLEDLNVDNPLGTKGELAKAFGDLVRGMWEGKDSYIYPRDFRDVLCDHARQFLGYEQHDSQEFLAYLLDGIHEDVNRVRDKPFVEKVEANSGECDDKAATRAWEAHLRRNDSFVVDTMHGQYKSVVTCPVEGCGKTSTTFDPAMYVTVPLPDTAEKSVEVILATLDGCRPKRYGVWVSKTAKVEDLVAALSKACGVREDRLALADVWQHKLQSVYQNDQSVSDVRIEDAVAYELPEWPKPPPLAADDASSFHGSSSSSSGFALGGGSREFGGENGCESIGGSGWEPKLAPFLLRSHKEKELRNGSNADGRGRLLKKATAYLDRFPRDEELEELTHDRELGSTADDASVDLNEDVKNRLKRASDHDGSFTELSTLEEVAGFGEAVASLRQLVIHEQREVTVQITQQRSNDLGSYGRYTGVGALGRSTAFAFPVLLSYLPHSTTVGDFREILAVLLRRLVLPRDTKNEGDGMDFDFAAEEGEIKDAAQRGDGDDANDGSDPARRWSGERGPGDPDNVVRLFRSGELELLLDDPLQRWPLHAGNILGGGGDRDGDLISKWLEDGSSSMAKLTLRWSDDALREAFDATETQQVIDDPSVEACRSRVPETLSMTRCLQHFLEREQLDESEMWYCSSCKEHRRAYKELSLWRLPTVLIIHLKRFSYDTNGGWAASREKVDSFVTFPVKGLDMRYLKRAQAPRNGAIPTRTRETVAGEKPGSMGGKSADDFPMDGWIVVEPQQQAVQGGVADAPTTGASNRASSDDEGMEQAATRLETEGGLSPRGGVDEEDVYDLRGVVNHYGGLNGGHYTAFALNEHDDRWYDFSDDRVSAVENGEDELVTSAAYVLFYQRRDGDSGGRGACADLVRPATVEDDGAAES